MIRYFKLPLIVTGVAFVLALIVVVAGATWIHQSKISDRKKFERAQQMGTATATATCIIIAPFWLVAAAKVGKARRAKKALSR